MRYGSSRKHFIKDSVRDEKPYGNRQTAEFCRLLRPEPRSRRRSCLPKVPDFQLDGVALTVVGALRPRVQHNGAVYPQLWSTVWLVAGFELRSAHPDPKFNRTPTRGADHGLKEILRKLSLRGSALRGRHRPQQGHDEVQLLNLRQSTRLVRVRGTRPLSSHRRGRYAGGISVDASGTSWVQPSLSFLSHMRYSRRWAR